MINVRIIPCLLLKDKKLVKTIQYKNPQYIGDPLNAIRIFNNLFVDELILININQAQHTPIDFQYLKTIASECFIPLCYGGGVDSLETAIKLFSLGFEKLSINSSIHQKPELLKSLSNYFGSQSIVGTIDCKKTLLSQYKVCVHNKKFLKYSLIDYALMLEDQGIGELLVNAIHKEGLMTGYDVDLLNQLAEKISVPIIANCGAGSLLHMKEVLSQTGINAFAASSLFIYNGNLKAVLINYPEKSHVETTFKNGLKSYDSL